MAVRKWSEEDRAFARGIHESPLDDMPRLVYADWLEERGDPLGKFIRLHCLWTEDSGRLKKGPLPFEEECLGLNPRTRLHELREALPQGWDRPRPAWIDLLGYERGMPWGKLVWMSGFTLGARFRKAHQNLCPLMALSVEIVGCDSCDLDMLVSSSIWDRTIDLSLCFADDTYEASTILQLARLPRVPILRRIRFEGLSLDGLLRVERDLKPIANNISIVDAWDRPA